MKQCILIRTFSSESNKVIDLLNKNEIEYQSILEYSEKAKPVLLTPEGAYPYKGFEDIESYVNAIKIIHPHHVA